MSSIFRTLIVPANQVTLARRLCVELAGQPGDGMFTTGLAAEATATPTHYISSGIISAEFAQALSDPQILKYACDNHVPVVVVTQQECNNLLSASTVSDGTLSVTVDNITTVINEDVHATIKRLGLVLCVSAEEL